MSIGEADLLPLKYRIVFAALGVIILIAVLCGAASIPFNYPSQSILYKFGYDKIFLRIGKVLGMLGATLLLFQIVLSGRFRLLDKIFGLNRLYFFHRINALLVCCIVLLHPFFIFAREDISNFSFQKKYWPEAVGVLLLLLLLGITLTGLFRRFFRLAFKRWWLLHRIFTFIAIIALFTHVRFVSDTFERGLPRTALFFAATLYFLVFSWIKLKPFTSRKVFIVKNATREAANAFQIEAIPRQGVLFNYMPGQFAFITVQSSHVSSEEHPFTISSTPTRPESLHFTIKACGDWTDGISKIKQGDMIRIDGPYGCFNHLACSDTSEFIFIAGGIGITPLLSMLRYMADKNDKRPITLIWSNKTDRDIAFHPELDELQHRLDGLHIIHLLTREKETDKKPTGRISRQRLADLLATASRHSEIFLCGPPLMIKNVSTFLKELGFPSKNIHQERFEL